MARGRLLMLSVLVGVLCGSASALLIFALNWATVFRESHLWIIALLPVAGFATGWLYLRFGKEVDRGHELILEEIHDPKTQIPLQMGPLIFAVTVVNHVFGASVGREGTAVQMGAALADHLSRLRRLNPLRGSFEISKKNRRVLLMAGMASGFGSVFGVPFAGAVFGLEVLTFGSLGSLKTLVRFEYLGPCLVAALVGERVTRLFGVERETVNLSPFPEMSFQGVMSAIAAGAACGFVSLIFVKSSHMISNYTKHKIKYAPLRPFLAGAIVACGAWVLGTTAYLGLGLPTIAQSFVRPVSPWAWLGKLVFTAISLGGGLKGGEVTPLFFMGSTLGNALAGLLPLSLPVLAAICYVGVFAGASNTPIASTFMALELFGPKVGLPAAITCAVSSFCTFYFGPVGIYQPQQIDERGLKTIT